MAEARSRFFESREFQNAHETASLELAAASLALSAQSAAVPAPRGQARRDWRR